MNLISYKVVALILEPYTNAMTAQNANKRIENQKTDQFESSDDEIDFDQNEPYTANSEDEFSFGASSQDEQLSEHEAEPKYADKEQDEREDKDQNEDIEIEPEKPRTRDQERVQYFPQPKNKQTNKTNVEFDDTDEYDLKGNKTKFKESDYIGDAFDSNEYKIGDFVEGNLQGGSVEDNTTKHYAMYLFKTENREKVQINRDKTNVHYNTFKNHLLKKVYPKYGINFKIMSKSEKGDYFFPDKTKMAAKGIKKLPLWFDIDVQRTQEGLPKSQTQRQKEALGFNCVCHHCAWRLGTARGGMILTIKDVEFDGVTRGHQLIKYKNKQAPNGQMQAMGEIAKGDAVLACSHCHKARGNDYRLWKKR